jgi:predicted RNA-binding protein with RPS1 domain/glutaredoxin
MTDSLVGEPLRCKILQADREENKLVVSNKMAVMDEVKEKILPGVVVSGVTTAIMPYGCFVEIGGISGLIHISQISADHVNSIADVLPVGITIKAMVLEVNKAKGKIGLATKSLEPEPGDMLKDRERVFEKAEETAAIYHERMEAARIAREKAAEEVLLGFEGIFEDEVSDEPFGEDRNEETSNEVNLQALDDTINSADVIFFDNPTCPFCRKAEEALKQANIEFKMFPIIDYKDMLIQKTGKSSAPSVWIKGAYVGGCNDGTEPWMGVLPMLSNGKFQEMMKA